MKNSVKAFMPAILSMILIVCVFLFTFAKPDNASPQPPVPIEENSSITHIRGSLGYEVNAYKVNVEGLDFLVIVNANKGGVTVTRIK